MAATRKTTRARAADDGVRSARAAAAKARARAEAAKARAIGDVAGAVRVALSGGYDSASRSRLNNKTVPRQGSANAFLDQTTRTDMRRWCRDLERNSIVARGLIQAHQDALVGDGGTVAATTKNAAWNKLADRLFREWAENADPDYLGPADITGQRSFWQCLAALVQSWDTHGDELWIHAVDPQTGRLTLQCVPGEQVVNPGGEASGDKRNMIGGVELTDYGRPVRYHVGRYDETGSFLSGQTTPIPASEARLMVNPRLLRTGQVRGEPGLQAVAKRIDQIDQFIVHTGYAAQVSTLFGLLIKTESPGDTQGLHEDATDDQPERTSTSAPKEIELGPGFVQHLAPNESVEQVKPEHPTTQFKDFVLTNLLIASADLGVPMPVWLYDVAGLTASNLKALIGLAWRRFAAQQDYLIHRAISWVYRAKIQDFIVARILPQNDEWGMHQVMLPQPPVMDFKAEAEGFALAIEKNLIARETATRMLGTGEAEDIAVKRAAERRRDIQLGIAPPELPGAKSGVPEGSNAEGAEDAEKTKPEGGEEKSGADEGMDGGKPEPKAAAKPAAKPPVDGQASGGGFLVGDKTLAADMVTKVAAGSVPAESASAILTTMVGLSPDQAQSIIGPAAGFEPTAPDQPPVQPADAPVPAGDAEAN